MSEPFVFHFCRGDKGQPEAMYMVDLRCACLVCGHPQYQRFYHSTPWHGLTLSGLETIAAQAHDKASYVCENCGTPVDGQSVEASALTFGFADDAGLVRIFVDRSEDRWQWQLVPRRRLDPQEMPRWQPNPDQGPVFDEDAMDESQVDAILERPFNPKLLWRELFQDLLQDPEGGAYARLAPGFWIVMDETEAMASELAEDIDDEDYWQAQADGELMVVALGDSVPWQLPTHAHPESMHGRYPLWLGSQAIEALEKKTIWAEAHISRTVAVEAIKRAFDSARLTYQIERTPADLFFYHITTPAEGGYGKGLPVSSVLRRAVYTGMTPGDAARLTAEEIIGMLLRVWK